MSDRIRESIEPDDSQPTGEGMQVPSGYRHLYFDADRSWGGSVDFSNDGAGDLWGKRAKSSVSAIFIHAGAGYHSIANEQIHLTACSE